MEAATVAWHPLGWKPVGFAEIEPFPSAILAHHYPTIPNYNDLTKHTEWPIEQGAINLLVGGTPCQSYSVAGKREGLNDPRGQLMFSFLDLAERLKPRWIVWENVPGVLSSGQPKGSDFGCFLQGLVERGYGVAYRVLDARWFGVPQRRRRVFVVACLGNWSAAAEVLSLAQGLSGHLEKGDKKRKSVTTNAGEGFDASGLQRTVGTLCADTHPGAYSGQDAYTGRLIPEQVPFRKSKRATSKTDNETWVEGDVSNTLNNFDLGDTRTTHAVVYENHPNDSRVTGPHDVAPTVVSRFGTGGGNVPLVNQEPKIIKTSELRLTGKITEQDTCPTLTAGAKSGDTEPLAITFQVGNLVRAAGAMPSTDATTTLKATSGDQVPCICHPIDLRNATRSPDKHDEMNRQGAGLGKDGEPSHTLTNASVPGVAYAYSVREDAKANNFSATPIEVSTALQSLQPSAQSHHAQTFIAQVLSPTITTCKGSRGGSSSEAIEEITAIHNAQQGVDLYNQTLTGDLHCPLRTAGGHGAPAVMAFDAYNQSVSHISKTLNSSASDVDHVGAVYSPTMAVRRLTPIECERLQGFPDNHSRIPWKGKPAEQCPDGPRYKACGNSMAVPVMAWIGKQIAIVDAKLNQ